MGRTRIFDIIMMKFIAVLAFALLCGAAKCEVETPVAVSAATIAEAKVESIEVPEEVADEENEEEEEEENDQDEEVEEDEEDEDEEDEDEDEEAQEESSSSNGDNDVYIYNFQGSKKPK